MGTEVYVLVIDGESGGDASVHWSLSAAEEVAQDYMDHDDGNCYVETLWFGSEKSWSAKLKSSVSIYKTRLPLPGSQDK